ncbi:MAG: hypothetical protein M3138_05885 [Actinomycetota bacterium]|nr:hypothetical protein [Actinomycetota bacterium]
MAGLLVFWGGIWLTNGLRAQDTSERDREQELLRRRAGAAWEDVIATEVGAIGQIGEGQPPVILPQVRPVITRLAERTPEDAVSTLRAAAQDAREAIEGIDAYELSNSLRNKGFNQAQVLRFLSAKDDLVTSIELYRQAALAGVLVADLEGEDRRAAIARAEELLSLAETAVFRFQTHQGEALAAAGIIQQPAIPGA